MKKAKNNNKGFSLVELIVVVLILGILAVAVSPQVMKWVGTSRINSDKDNANALKSSISTALADWQGQGGKISTTADDNYVIQIKNDKTASYNTESSTNWTGGTSTLQAYIEEVTAKDYPKAQYEVYTGDGLATTDNVAFLVTIYSKTGKVEVKCQALTITD